MLFPFWGELEADFRNCHEAKVLVSRIQPHNRLVLLEAKDNHVVICRNDYLILVTSRIENIAIRRSPCWLPLAPDVFDIEREFSEGTCDARTDVLVK